jgi:ribosomal protein L3 glutamine methyltransferase
LAVSESASFTTLGEAVEFAEHAFLDANLSFGHGMPEAFDEAAYLVLHTLHLPLDDLDSVWERPLSASECASLSNLFDRRVRERVPAAYLTREAWLGPFRFYVDERVIVPRSFIAELLLEALSPWIADPDQVGSILDLCTGSGCLAIVAAEVFPQARLDAVDLSADALAVAEKNVADYGLNDRIELIASDLFTGLTGRRYDVIISNPPYVTGHAMSALPDEYRREPEMALASGSDGLDHMRAILRDAPAHLHEGGLLVVEVGFNRAGVEAAFPQVPFTWLEVSAGDGVVFMISCEELLNSLPSRA